jgi:hypothetical protein
MKVEISQVTKLLIRDVKNIDVIAVYLEDFLPGVGKATITCANDSWSYGWSAMGTTNDIRKFLIQCDTPYLAQKFGPNVPRTETDHGNVVKAARTQILETRKSDGVSKETARKMYDEAEDLFDIEPSSSEYADQMYEIYGDEWWHCLPTVPHYQYVYLCKIIDTVKEALKEQK